jgi:hypothetical protein
MKSTKLQVLVPILAVLVAAGFLAARGLPPAERIHYSAWRGDVNDVRRALNWGVAVNAKIGRDETPLRAAANADRQEVIDLLIAHGAESRSCLEQDARGFVEREVTEANDWAARYVDGRTYAQTDEQAWLVFFVPQGTPKSDAPPAGAIRHEWTDRQVMTIERHYRYRVAAFGEINGPRHVAIPFRPMPLRSALRVASDDIIKRLVLTRTSGRAGLFNIRSCGGCRQDLDPFPAAAQII